MILSEHITPNAISCKESASSKKKALEKLSHYLALAQSELNESLVFDKLLERERLGSTGLGEGVAIPHCRMAEAKRAMVAMITLDHGVDFDSRDAKPVDILFALVVPEDCNETHLKILAAAAEMFSDPAFCAEMRACSNSQTLYEMLISWQPKSLSA
ncbi:MAG: PTS sugar transporter subunit IIA [Gammaproteobacteria bacterium]|nr:PTS sugar transporter subunit IIA [Gammaproteobacteria bacterium]